MSFGADTMTILSQNVKALRKHLNCSQIELSEALCIGFRSYVRYEAGERDAPVTVLVKLARLANISLDRFLTCELNENDFNIHDKAIPPTKSRKLIAIRGSLREGRLTFKGIQNEV